jgi:Flp pilus assembly protein TadG
MPTVEQLLHYNPFCKACPAGTITMKTVEPPRSSRNQPRSPSSKRRVGFGAQCGQSLLELALVLPMLLLLLVGTIEIGRFAYYSIVVSNAARAGAQYGAQNLTAAADLAGMQTAANNDANIAGLTVTPGVQCGCTGTTAGLSGTCPATLCVLPNHPLVYVQVTATRAVSSLFSYPGLPATVTLTSTEKMRVAQ